MRGGRHGDSRKSRGDRIPLIRRCAAPSPAGGEGSLAPTRAQADSSPREVANSELTTHATFRQANEVDMIDAPRQSPSQRPDSDLAGPRMRVLWASTWAFTALFAVWLMLGVLGLE